MLRTKKYSEKWWRMWRAGAFPMEAILLDVAAEASERFAKPSFSGISRDNIVWAAQKLQMNSFWGWNKTEACIERAWNQIRKDLK
jgi:hypothetical protein